MDDIRAQRRWWWMDRNNKFHDVPSEGHAIWAARFLKKVGYDLSERDIYSTRIYHTMYSLGFIKVGIMRFGSEDAQIVYEYDPKNPPDYHKIDLIKQLGTEYGVKWITDGIRNKKDAIMEGKLTKTLKEVIHKTVDNVLNEAVDVREFVKYYQERAEELQKHAGFSGFATGTFQFDLFGGALAVMCDVLHSDTVTNAAQMLDKNRFIIKNSTVKTVFTMEPFNFDINLFISDVLYVMKQMGLQVNIGMALSRTGGSTAIMLGRDIPGHITVNTYTGDTITAQLELRNIKELLEKDAQSVARAIDIFIMKMFEVIKAMRKFYGEPIKEAYDDKFDSSQRDDEANLYFSIGQEDGENVRNSWCWIWDKINQSVKAAKGGTHSLNFGGPRVKDYTYSGWYDPEKNAISFVFPDSELRKFGDRRPTEDDIPQQVYQKLINKFGTRRPRFVVFDEVVQKDIKANINIPPERTRYDDKGYLRFDLLNLDNLKALREKASRSWAYWSRRGDDVNVQLAMEAFKRYDDEIKRRLQYINRPVKEIRLEPPVDNVLIREDSDDRDWRAWWMEPDGTLHEVYKGSLNYGHWKFAKDYVLRHGLITDKELADGLCVMTLMDKGWVRLTFNYYKDGALHFDKSKTRPLSERTMSEVKSLAIELRASKLIDDNLNKEISLLQENMTYDELLKLTAKTPRSPEDNTNRIDRSKTVAVRSLPVSVEEGLEQWNFRYKSSPQSTITDEPFEGHITFLKGEVDNTDDAARLECKVDCGCPDYMYKFAYNNYAQGAGDIGPDSENGAINRRPKPAYDIGEGLCKHLSALAKYLATKVTATKKQNIFEAIDEVAKQGPFNVTYEG